MGGEEATGVADKGRSRMGTFEATLKWHKEPGRRRWRKVFPVEGTAHAKALKPSSDAAGAKPAP